MRLSLLVLHILAGTVGLLSGTFAIAVRKGSRMHRASGNIFTVAMLTLAGSAFCLAIMKSQHGNIIGSIITFYMITTAWLAGAVGASAGLTSPHFSSARRSRSHHHTRRLDPTPSRQERPRCYVLLHGRRPPARRRRRHTHARARRNCWPTAHHASPLADVLWTFHCNRIFLPWPATGLSRFPARLHVPYDPRRSAIPLDDLLAHSRPL